MYQDQADHIPLIAICTISDYGSFATPAAVAHFYEFQDILCALDLLLLKPHNLHLLFPVLQHP